jgi:Holliday junction DNA helicase RuvA
MIEYLSGEIKRRHASGIILDVKGIGYGLELTIPDMCDLISAKECSLWVHTRVREDLIKLYGFLVWEDKETFEALIAVNGIGPKIAIAILSTLTPSELKRAVHEKRTEILELVPGIGRRSAEKIIVEMTGKIDRLSTVERSRNSGGLRHQEVIFDTSYDDQMVQDVVGALVNLGFKDKDVGRIVDASRKLLPDADLPALLKASLQSLRKSPSIEM